MEVWSSAPQTCLGNCCEDDRYHSTILLDNKIAVHVFQPLSGVAFLPSAQNGKRHIRVLSSAEGTSPSPTPEGHCDADEQALLSSSFWPEHW